MYEIYVQKCTFQWIKHKYIYAFKLKSSKEDRKDTEITIYLGYKIVFVENTTGNSSITNRKTWRKWTNP